MGSEVKMEHGFGSSFATDSVVEEDLESLSIPDLIKRLRNAFRTVDFDRVAEALVKKEGKLKRENKGHLRSNHMATLDRMEIEHKLEACREQCKEYKVVAEKAKRSQEEFEKLLEQMKKNEFEGKFTIAEHRAEINKLEQGKHKAESRRVILMEKVEGLTQRISRMEDDSKLLSEKINARSGFHFKLKKQKEAVGVDISGGDFLNKVAGSSPQSNGNGHLSGSSGKNANPQVVVDNGHASALGGVQLRTSSTGVDSMAEKHKRKLGSTSACPKVDENSMDRFEENSESSSGSPSLIDHGYGPIPPAFRTDRTDKRRKRSYMKEINREIISINKL